jgi:hypothetical protein
LAQPRYAPFRSEADERRDVHHHNSGPIRAIGINTNRARGDKSDL